MIRINVTGTGSEPVVQIAGKLDARHLAEVAKECDRHGEGLVLDLSELLGADGESLCWLRARIERGDRTVGATPYVQLLLERVASSEAAASDDE
jgi:hypothetical protein